MSLLENFDITVNFWNLNPQMKYVGEFDKFYKKDRSKDKQNSSQIMWAIALYLDKSKANNFRNLPEEERKLQLTKYFLKDETFDWDNEIVKPLINTYHSMVLTQAERSLISWEKKLKERDEFIDKTTYDSTSYDMLDKMMSATYKMYQQYDAIRAQLELEQDTDDNKKQYVTEI